MNNSSSNRKNNNQRRPRGGRRRGKQGLPNVAVSNRDASFAPRYMPNLPNTYPSVYRVNQCYSTNFLIESDTNAYNWTYRLLNGVYDPDDGGSGNDRNYTGFNEISQSFNSYIVEHVKYEIGVINEEPDASAFLTFCPLTYDPSTVGAVDGNVVQNFAEAPYGHKMELGRANGMDRAKRRGVLAMASLVDPRLYYGASEYRGYYNSNPSTPIYFCMGAFNNAAPLTLNVSLKFTATIRYSDRIIPIDSSTIPPSVFSSRVNRPNVRPLQITNSHDSALDKGTVKEPAVDINSKSEVLVPGVD